MVSFLYGPTLTLYMNNGKNTAWTIPTFVGKVMSLLYNVLSKFVIAFLPKSKHLWISWLLSLSSVILETKNKICQCFYFFPFYQSGGAIILVFFFFLMLNFKPTFSFSSFSLIKRLFSSSSVSEEWYHLHIWDCWYFSQQSGFHVVIHPIWDFKWCTLHTGLP